VFLFVKGTNVLTLDGFEAIENLIVGDTLISYNINKEVGETSTINKVYKSYVDDIYLVVIDSITIEVTGEHPFYVLNRGWIKVKDLESGMYLKSQDEKNIRIDEITRTDERFTVYNIEVTPNNNYYVSKRKVLVHNKNIK
jgi:intein/homing endonuclease